MNRVEHDLVGEMAVPENAYYGIHALRAASRARACPPAGFADRRRAERAAEPRGHDGRSRLITRERSKIKMASGGAVSLCIKLTADDAPRLAILLMFFRLLQP